MSVTFAGENNRASLQGRARQDWWTSEAELLNRLEALHERANAAVGHDIALSPSKWGASAAAAESASVLTHACIERLRGIPARDVVGARQLCDLVMSLQQFAMDAYLNQTSMRSRRLADCAAGLSRLRGVSSSQALMEGACEELVARCGFHRAVVSKLEAHSWKPLILHNRDDNAATRSWFTDWVNQSVPLSDTAPEAAMISKRRPSLVYDTADAPVYRPLIVQAGQSRSYVVAPLVQGDDVIGFLHTDHHPLARRVDEADRDVLWAFADGFSHIYERAVLVERLRIHRDSVRELFFGAIDRIDELCDSGREAPRFADGAEQNPVDLQAGRTMRSTVDLTEREAEVFDLMVTGASNQDIADRLVITEGTVKSHVKHILRKYGAVNRAQAIAWALSDS